MPVGHRLFADAVAPQTCAAWLSRIDAAYADVAAVPTGAFVEESSSFRLASVAGIGLADIWSAFGRPLADCCVAELGASLVIDVDQCWVRRQYPAAGAPERHHPHSWHQDGALGFDFIHPGAEGLLEMVTLWIALTPCGRDAPGLELVPTPIDVVLRPPEMTADAVDERWPETSRLRPQMSVGDVLVLGGAMLHRTHRNPAMTQTRTSIELRCFPGNRIPRRLQEDRFVAVSALRSG